jgi:hypothetical protein
MSDDVVERAGASGTGQVADEVCIPAGFRPAYFRALRCVSHIEYRAVHDSLCLTAASDLGYAPRWRVHHKNNNRPFVGRRSQKSLKRNDR